MNFRRFFLSAAAIVTVVAAYAQGGERRPDPDLDYQFTTIKEVPITSVKDQHRSGTCWCFSALSFIESEILRTKGIEVDLSEMFVVGKSYHDRAIKYVRLDGNLGFSAGSEFGDVFHVISDYGIVTQEAMSGMNYGSELPEQSELDGVLESYVKVIAKNPNRKLSTAWLNGFDGIITAYLGEYPESFEFNGVTYTPESFRDYLGINTDEYVSLTSFTHHPFYEPFVMEVCDNWRWDAAYNLPIDEFMEVMFNAIDKGYSIAWGSDVSEKGFTRNGIAIAPENDELPKPGSDQERWTGKPEENPEGKPQEALMIKEKEVTQELRQFDFEHKLTTDDHGMHIFGIAEDQNGVKYFMVKNSWGDSGKYEGIWYASETFVKYKTLNIVVHKDALPVEIAKKLGIK